MTTDRLIKIPVAIAYLMVLWMFCSVAKAQTQAWNENIVSWSAPTACTTGEPISACQVTGYRVEMSSTSAGTYATVGTTQALTYTHSNLTAGPRCYRVIALSAQGDSAPSNFACKTTVKPAGPPNPPTNLVVTVGIAYNVRPDYERFAFVRSTYAGKVAVGASCDETRTVGSGYYVIDRPSRVTPRPATGTVLVAKCS